MTSDRIVKLMVVFGIAAFALLGGLYALMGWQHDSWLERSYRNRWAFRDVPSRRGAILDRNLVPVAWDEPGVDLELRYRGFRRLHPVGVAVHGANLLKNALGRQAHFDFADEDRRGRLTEACALLLRTPIGLLGPHAKSFLQSHSGRSGVVAGFTPEDARDLRFYSSSILAGLSGLRAFRFHLAIRNASADEEQLERTVLDIGRSVCRGWNATQGRASGAVFKEVDLEVFGRAIDELEGLNDRLGPDSDLFQILSERHDAWRGWHQFVQLDEVLQAALRTAAFWVFLREEKGVALGGSDDWKDVLRVGVDTSVRSVPETLPIVEFAEEFLGLDDDVRQALDAVALGERAVGDAGSAGDAPSREGAPGVGATTRVERPNLPWNEDVPRTIARRMRYEDALWLRIAQRRHPGFGLMPSVRRAQGALPGRQRGTPQALGTLEQLLGTVTPAWKRDATQELQDSSFALGAAGVGEILSDWPEDLPESLEAAVKESAGRAVHRHFLTRGRFGRGGVEGALDDRLRGTPGMRFVERDRRREQRLFSALDVDAGLDTRLTIDLRLQRILEDCLAEAEAGVERGATLLDTRTGDILAIAGWPFEDEKTGNPRFATPALMASRNAAIGSVVKPFMALEQLECERLRLPCAQPGDFEDCDGQFNRNLSCSHAHGMVARDPVHAIGQSCNFYFYAVVRGFGDEGLLRAFRRVGWIDEHSKSGIEPPPAFVSRIPGLSGGVSAPHRPASGTRLELQAIGYGIHVNTLFVARAYAALATGALLPPRLVLDDPVGDAVPLGVHPDSLDLVRQGLRECVVSGTGRRPRWSVPVFGKTGTAEVGEKRSGKNNSWFAGYVPAGARAQLAFAVALYEVPRNRGGGRTAAPVVAQVLDRILLDPELARDYLPTIR